MISVLKKIKRFWRYLGAGLITGAADDDAAAITTYAIAGTRLGLSSLWTVFFTFPLMSAVQEMSARIGMVTKTGLAGVIKKNYPAWVLAVVVLLMVSSNIFNIGADISGMSAASNLIIPSVETKVFNLIYAGAIVFLVIFLSFKKIVRYFKWLVLTLIFYVASALFISHDWLNIFQKIFNPGLLLNKESVSIIVAIFGTTIAPYLFFWQTSQEAFEEKSHRHNHNLNYNDQQLDREVSRMRIDVTFGMFFSNLIKFFIIILATTLFFNTSVRIQTIDELSLLLKPLLGDFGQFIFTLGIVGTGLLIIPILAAGSAYILAETFQWQAGLEKKFNRAKEFYLVIIISTILALVMNYFGLNPVRLLFYTAFIHGLISPVLILMILIISNNKKIMGNYKNGKSSNILGFGAFSAMTLAIVLLLLL